MDQALAITDNHKTYNTMLQDNIPTICIGSQGTGKSYGAVEEAVKRLLSKDVKKIIISRPNVPFAESLGLLPGTDMEKLAPWVRPIKQLLLKFIAPFDLETYEKVGIIEYLPFEHIQGLTFDNAFIILDECQNVTFGQAKIFLGRQGMHSKTVMCGDIKQESELFKDSGLHELVSMIRALNTRCHLMEFTLDDCLRSQQCKDWLTDFEEWDTRVEAKKRMQRRNTLQPIVSNY